MDPLSLVGIASSVVQVSSSVLELLTLHAQDFFRNLADYGPMRTLLLHTNFLQAKYVISRVRRHVLDDHGEPDSLRIRNQESEAWALKKSYAASLNMIAVAGAIVAQIAITALSLPYLEQTHWTVEAAFVISLVAGLLSVYYACMVQLILGGLQDPKETKQWLTTYRTMLASPSNSNEQKEAGRAERGYVLHIPSYYSALLLVAPSGLLNWSLASLLIGIGIYFGLVLTEKLGLLRGDNSNLAVLIVYIVFTYGALVSYYLPTLLKLVETSNSAERARTLWAERYHAVGDIARNSGHADNKPGLNSAVVTADTSNQEGDGNDEDVATPEANPADTDDLLRALKESIAAQAGSLRAQEALLRSYLRRG